MKSGFKNKFNTWKVALNTLARASVLDETLIRIKLLGREVAEKNRFSSFHLLRTPNTISHSVTFIITTNQCYFLTF